MLTAEGSRLVLWACLFEMLFDFSIDSDRCV